jgi:hypothetical protein
MYMTTTNSRAGAMFIQKGSSNKYLCVEHVSLDHESAEVKFEPIGPAENVSSEDLGFSASYEVTSTLNIPITVHNDCIGMVCLLNSPTGYQEEVMNELTPYISLTQLVLSWSD